MNNLKELSLIIQDYRKGELPIPLDEKHITKWLNQFDENIRDDILSEILHIFRKWYFDSQSIIQFGTSVFEFLKNKYSLNDLYIYNNQAHGKSQSKIISLLRDNGIANDCMLNNSQSKHYVYLDDGLYSGSTIRDDVKSIVNNHNLHTIDIFVLLAYSDGYDYTRKVLAELGEKNNTVINVYRFRELQNVKKVERIPPTGQTIIESYYNEQDILWPKKDTFHGDSQLINEYTNLFDNENYLFRSSKKKYSSIVFSSDKAREILETEFLKKGFEIIKSGQSNRKKLYPLGLDSIGSICAFDFNISNTCPLVLWWGNLIKQGNALDIWYPLLPRRIE